MANGRRGSYWGKTGHASPWWARQLMTRNVISASPIDAPRKVHFAERHVMECSEATYCPKSPWTFESLLPPFAKFQFVMHDLVFRQAKVHYAGKA
jgi:hypothetical protein